MASVIVERDHLHIELSTGEKFAAVRRTDLLIPWSDVAGVERVAEPFRLVHGLRAPGMALPWRTRIGTWRSAGRKIFAVTHSGASGIWITLRGNEFNEILISHDGPDSLVAMIRTAIEVVPDRSGPVERPVTIWTAGFELTGSALLPGAGRPMVAAAVIVTGSGQLDRDGSDRRAPIDVSRQLAHSLVTVGIASLRYDKRGVAGSGGDYYRTGLQDNIDDARAAAQTLRRQPECEAVPMVLIGHSEGALIAAAVAGAPGTPLDAVVLLAGPAKTGEQTLLWQAARIAPTLPRPVTAILRLFRTDPVKRQRTFIARIRATTADSTRMGGLRINTKWFRELLDFDPVPLLAAIDVPVLAITGDKDLQVDPADLEIVAATVPGPVTTWRIDDLTHILRRDPAEPTLGHYRTLIKEPIDPTVTQNISAWIEQIAASDEGWRRPESA